MSEPIAIRKVAALTDHPLLQGLLDDLSFDDGEGCWGDWVSDANVLLETSEGFNDQQPVPMLVTRRVSYNGLAIWINSGYKLISIAHSISQPQEHLVRILSKVIQYPEAAKAYRPAPSTSTGQTG